MQLPFFRKSIPVSSRSIPLVELDPSAWTQVSGGSGPHGGWIRPAGTGTAVAAARPASFDPMGPHGGWKTDVSGPHGGW